MNKQLVFALGAFVGAVATAIAAVVVIAQSSPK